MNITPLHEVHYVITVSAHSRHRVHDIIVLCQHRHPTVPGFENREPVPAGISVEKMSLVSV